MRYDEKTARCYVLTFKEGVLSAVAHDLRIDVTRFTIDVADDAASVSAEFDAASLRVACAVRDGADAAGVLSASDKAKIEENIVGEVLEARRHPNVELRSTRVAKDGDRHSIDATLRLHGVERKVSFVSRFVGDREVARVRLHQPDYGIRPYRAMLGALRVQADVEVVVELPRNGKP